MKENIWYPGAAPLGQNQYKRVSASILGSQNDVVSEGAVLLTDRKSPLR